jgi:hypothetical protein
MSVLEKDKPILLGEIPFHDVWVKVYHGPNEDEHSLPGSMMCAWSVRNPDAFYKGYCWMDNSTGQITYPEGAIIPVATKEDREMLPKVLVTYCTEITEDFINHVSVYLEKEYLRRNHRVNIE